jgi:hypothetical protein
MVMDSLVNAINSEHLKSTLSCLNKHFYNRKHEGQIRDAVLVELNERSDYVGVSEYPKCGVGSVDLTLFSKENGLFSAATVFKHHYPKDLNNMVDVNSIISDVTRTVENKTTHFVLIIQVRGIEGGKFVGPVKYMERNDSEVETYVKKLEADSRFPTYVEKRDVSVEVSDEMESTYYFYIYQF